MTSRALEGELESDEEELRFFSQPPPGYADASEGFSPSSLSPTSSAVHNGPRNREARAEAARFDARRAKLQRRVVATLWAAVSLLMLGLVVHGRAEAERRRADAAPVPAVAHPAPVVAPHPVVTATPATSAAAEPVSAPAEPAVPLESVAAPASAAELIQKARSLLNSGRSREGVLAAREALTQSPLDAEPYMLLGAGLQDLGKYAEARAVFDDCLKLATHGPVASCRYFARR